MKKVPIIGIGASAGGLKELETFFKNMPSSKDVAFVIIQHLSPNYKSILADIVNRYTEMDVCQVEDQMLVTAGNVYIIPPNKLLALKEGQLCLLPMPRDQGIHLPIDVFFRSLKDNLGEKAIAVILSGTGSDGTLGIKEVKEAGGLTIVQQPDTADYDGMPINAIKTGLIDFVIPVAEMPRVILNYIQNEFLERGIINTKDKKTDDIIVQIFDLVKEHTGNDFGPYKRNTIYRRIERRLTVNKLGTLIEYLELLKSNSSEVAVLCKEFLISVTSFFRDIDTFRFLETNIIQEVVSRAENTVRIWVPACATGEEAYSWAILFKNYIDDNKLSLDLQVFASDIDVDAIDKAREGYYNNSVIADVPNHLLDRYFIKEPEGYHIKKTIRETVIFAEQNLVQDPPYSRLDMVSCRNLLIYFDGELQQKAISIAHYALNPNGVLVLGNSESLGNSAQCFKVIDRNFRIFQKLESPDVSSRVWKLSYERQQQKLPHRFIAQESVSEIAKGFILERHTPPSVVVDKDGEMIYAQGRTGKFLEIATGQITTNIIRIAKDGLKMPISNALRKAKINNKEITHNNIRVKTNGDYEYIDITVAPLSHQQTQAKLFIVLFQTASHANSEQVADQGGDHLTIFELEKELAQKEQFLQHTIEELETTNEELKSSSEEAQSTNEELQSTNEELETSKEELQSVNEELTTTNNELSLKVDELNKVNSHLSNLLSATAIATIFLDKELRIFSFTPAISIIVDLIQSDKGRSIKQFTNNLKYDNLINDVNSVLQTLIPKEAEVQSVDGRYFWMRISPYRTVEDKIEGVVVTFTDITEKKVADALIKESEEKYRITFENAPDSVIIHDFEMNIIDVNKKAMDEFGYSKAEFLKIKVFDLHTKEEVQHSQEVLGEMEKQEMLKVETKFLRKEGTVFWAEAIPCKYELNGKNIIHVVIRNITELVEIKNELLKHQQHLEELVEEKSVELAENEKRFRKISQLSSDYAYSQTVDEQQNIETEWIFGAFQRITGYAPNTKLTIDEVKKLVHPDDFFVILGARKKVLKGETVESEMRIITKSGEVKWIRDKRVPEWNDDRSRVVRIMGAVTEITRQKRVEEELKINEQKFRNIAENIPGMVLKYKRMPDGTNELLFANENVKEIFEVTHQELLSDMGVLWKRIHKDDFDDYVKAIKASTQNQTAWGIEHRLQMPDGRVKWLHVRGISGLGKDGSVMLDTVGIDITQRKKAEEELLIHQHYLKKAQEIGSIGSWYIDLYTNVITWTEENYNVFGVAPGTPIDYDRFVACIYPDDREYVNAEWLAAIKGKPYDIEHRLLVADQEKWVREKAEIIYNHKNEPIGAIGVTQDITPMKRVENELKKKAAELLKLSADKDKFISILAHDLKNPFNSLLGFSNLLVKNVRKYDIEIIERQVNLMNETIVRTYKMLEEILLWSRAHAGKIKYEPATVSLSEICETGAEVASNHAVSKGISLTCDIPAGLEVFTDGDILKAILRNLVTNAVKFTENGGRVVIGASRNEKEVQVSVKDTGVGIAAEVLANLFDGSLISSTKGTLNETGSGFGLLISKELIGKLGGRIWADSKVGKGSTFFFTIPVVGYGPVASVKKKVSRVSANKKLQILIAEDDTANFEYLEILFNDEISLDCEITHAINGKKAVELAKRQAPDLILMDIKMPIMDGFEAIRQIRAFNTEAKIIVQSANGAQANVDKAMALGCIGFLVKPISSEELDKMITENLLPV